MQSWTDTNSIIREKIIQEITPDIVFICETHLIKNNSLQLADYHWFGFNRPFQHVRAKSGSGGIGFLVHNHIFNSFHISVTEKSVDGLMVLELQHKASEFKISLIGVYLPPENSIYGRNATAMFAHLISLVYSTIESDVTLICGDLNARIGDGLDYIESIDNVPPRTVIDKTKNNHGLSLLEFLNDVKMCVLNGRITPEYDNFTSISVKGSSVVDYFITNHTSLKYCKEMKIHTVTDLIDRLNIAKLISHRCKPPDHSLISLKLSCSFSRSVNQSSTAEIGGIRNKMYCFEKRPEEFMNTPMWREAIMNLVDKRLIMVTSQSEVDVKYSDFCNILTKEMDKYLVVGNSSKRSKKKFKISKPYWNENLTNLWRSMKNRESEYLHFRGSRYEKQRLHFQYKTARHLFDKTLRQCERAYIHEKANELEKCNTSNPKEFWKHIKNLGPSKKSNIPIKINTPTGFCTNEKIVLQKWKDDFSTLYNAPDDQNFDDEFFNEIKQRKHFLEDNLEETNDFVNEPISYHEIEKSVKKLKDKKSVGFDSIPNPVLKHPDVILAMWSMFTAFFEFGVIPSIWLKSVVNPIPKGAKKDPYTPLNYRGISLLSCVYKVYTSILNTRILEYCEMLDIFVDEQNGFRKGRSCEDHIFVLNSLIQNNLEENKSVFAAFVDLEKAFDWVEREMLFYRLLQYNIDGKMYHAIKSLYSECQSCIKLRNNLCTDWFSVNSGVKQGDNVSPTLFSLYINELAKEIKDLKCGIKINNIDISILMYADDMVLVANTEEDLQSMLNKMYEWCRKWRLKVNTTKTNTVHFRSKNAQKTVFDFKLGDISLNTVSEYKYLGVIMDEHLTYETCSKTLADSAGRALSAVLSRFKSLKDVGYGSFTKMYETCVIPVADYGSSTWGYHNLHHSTKIQDRAIRYFLGVHRFTALPALHAEMGWLLPRYRKYLNMLRFWNRVINLPNDRLTKRVFTMDRDRCAKSSQNWTKNIKEIFDLIGMPNTFIKQQECDLNLCKDRLLELFEKECLAAIDRKPKLRSFKLFKTDCKTTDYVAKCINKYDRSFLAKFRCGILHLRIETGRFNGLKLEERICQCCNSSKVESELHFLCECSKYTELRNKMFQKVTERYPEFPVMTLEERFSFLMTKCSFTVLNFLKKAWKVRQESLYK